MKTYQDLLNVPDNDKDRIDFVYSVIQDHKNSDLYKEAEIARDYERHQNRTIKEFQKLLYTVTGATVPDNYSANWKMASNFFHFIVLQEVQYVLGNGVAWQKDETAGKLGEDFDYKIQKLAKAALWGSVSFGFYNKERLDAFDVLEFAPLYDEENGALMSGVRFWQIDSSKPLRATLYEPDGLTQYMWNSSESRAKGEVNGEVLQAKRPYIVKTKTTVADGEEIYDYENYPSFPIVPLWGNTNHQSEFTGLREQIDCYDLIKSGFANDVDDASLIYWTINNAGGMDDVDLAKFVERIKTLHAATTEDGTNAEAHSVDVPFASREALLDRIKHDIFSDAMALNPEFIAAAAVTATQIKAAYEPLNSKADDFEYCLLDFLQGILSLAGIDDKPTFTRSMLINASEEIQNILQASQFLTSDYITQKLLDYLGDGDRAEDMINEIAANEMPQIGAEEAVNG